MPASPARAGAAAGRAGSRHMLVARWPEASGPRMHGAELRRQLCARPARFQTKFSEPVPGQGPEGVAHPKLPALHLHVALLDNVVEIGRHGFPAFSWVPVWPRRREECPGGLSFRLLRSPVRDTPSGFPHTARSPAAPHFARLSIVLAAPSPGACWK